MDSEGNFQEHTANQDSELEDAERQILNDLRAFYDEDAVGRSGRGIEDWKESVRQSFAQCLRELTRCQPDGPQCTLLELGAGPGRDAAFFRDELGVEVVCLDLSTEMIRLCTEQGFQAHVTNVIEGLRFGSSAFNAVYAMNSLLHIPKNRLRAVLDEIWRVLTTDGLFYLGLYGGWDFEGRWPDDPSGKNRFFAYYSDESLKQAVSVLFEVMSFESIDLGARGNFQSFILKKKDDAAPH